MAVLGSSTAVAQQLDKLVNAHKHSRRQHRKNTKNHGYSLIQKNQRCLCNYKHR